MRPDDPRLKNLIPFKPGQVGNPTGPHPGPRHPSSIAKALRELMRSEVPHDMVLRLFGKDVAGRVKDEHLTGAQLSAQVLLMVGLQGNLEALRLMLAYTDGDPKQSVQIDADGDHVLTVETIREALTRVS